MDQTLRWPRIVLYCPADDVISQCIELLVSERVSFCQVDPSLDNLWSEINNPEANKSEPDLAVLMPEAELQNLVMRIRQTIHKLPDLSSLSLAIFGDFGSDFGLVRNEAPPTFGSIELSSGDISFDLFTVNAWEIENSSNPKETLRSTLIDLLRIEEGFAIRTVDGQELPAANDDQATLSKNTIDLNVQLTDLSRDLVLRIEEYEQAIKGINSISDPSRQSALIALLELKEAALGLSSLSLNFQLEDREIRSKIERYFIGVQGVLDQTLTAENLAKATVPTGLILTCGAVGGLLTVWSPLGPAPGYAAGAWIGKLVAGELKPRTASDKIEDWINDKEDKI